MSLETKRFEFEEFILDVNEITLLRDGEPVALTPKAFQLLLVLLKNQGRLVKKEDLMRAVWAESFVEEGNLTFTIRLLRKALQDSPQNPRFIKTVPLHGYKFIAAVKPISSEPENKISSAGTKSITEKIGSGKQKKGFSYLSIGAFASTLLVVSVALGGWYLKRNSATELPIFSAPFASEKISNSGKVVRAVLSPDGKTVVYVDGMKGKQSVWIRQVESGSNIEIIPPLEESYAGLAFSPDGNLIYFSRKPKNADGEADIFRVSIFGGIPTKIVTGAQGWMSLSPDGAKISFVRCYHSEDENCSLWIADSADGKNERKLVSRPPPYRIGGNKISSDGKSIAFAAGQSENQSNEFGLFEVEIETGRERELSNEKFFDIRQLVWLPDKSGLLVTASRIPNRNFRIWKVSADSAEPLTNDSESYSVLSPDKNFSRIVSTQFKPDFQLKIFDLENPLQKRILAEAEGGSFSPDGKIVFTSEKSGNMEIWGIEPDGSRQIQLTNDAGDDSRPVVSPDDNFIYFASNRSGEVQIWRMNADGSNQTQITQKDGGFPIFISPDGNKIFYHHGRDRTLRSIEVKTGEQSVIYDKNKYYFAISPDASMVAFSEKNGDDRELTIFSINEKRVIERFKTPLEKSPILEIEWMPDGKSILYLLTDNSFEKNTLWIQNLNGKPPRKISALSDEELSESNGFVVSPDGKFLLMTQGDWRHDAVLLKGLK